MQHQEITSNGLSQACHIRRKSHPYFCITSRQWTFWFLVTVVEDAATAAVAAAVAVGIGVEIEPPGLPAVTGVASQTPAEMTMSSLSLQTSCRRRTIFPKLPWFAASPSDSQRSESARRRGDAGMQFAPQISMGQTRHRSKPFGPEGINWRRSAICEIRLTVAGW